MEDKTKRFIVLEDLFKGEIVEWIEDKEYEFNSTWGIKRESGSHTRFSAYPGNFPDRFREIQPAVQRIETKEQLENRIETGALKINNDWKGYFFRGDDSLHLIMAIEYLIQKVKMDNDNKLKFHEEMYVKSLEETIKDIRENTLGGISNPLQLFTNAKKD